MAPSAGPSSSTKYGSWRNDCEDALRVPLIPLSSSFALAQIAHQGLPGAPHFACVMVGGRDLNGVAPTTISLSADGSVQPFREPAINRSQHTPRRRSVSVLVPGARHRNGGTQFPKPGM